MAQLSPQDTLNLNQAEVYILEPNLEKARLIVDEVLLRAPTSARAHLVAGKLAVAEQKAESASWHALMALRYDDESLYTRAVETQVIDPAFAAADNAPTCHLLRGLTAGLNGHLDEAFGLFRKSLAEAKEREERIRAIQFLVLTALELESFEAALGYVDELLQYDSENYLVRLWRSEILWQLDRNEEAAKENLEADRLLSEFESATRMEMGKPVLSPRVEIDNVPVQKGDLRSWLRESTNPVLAPLRVLLASNPGSSNQWSFLVDQLFSLDEIFGPSQALQDAEMLEELVANAVSTKKLNETIPFPRPIRHPFGQESHFAHGVVVQKVMASNARPALCQLVDENGTLMFPRLMWKKGDDLRRDLTAMVFFEVFNVIWKKSLGDIFLPVLTYGVLPLKNRVGFVEWVENTVTQQNFDWQKGDPERWIPSFVASMTAAFAIGAEDRHARNILVQCDPEDEMSRRVFQIDFGYLWGVQPGAGLGAGPALPYSNKVHRALSEDQRRNFKAYAGVLFDLLSLYKTEIAGLAHRFSEVVNLEVPVMVNVKSFVNRRLGSSTFFEQSIILAQRDRGRFRKEYLALAWGNKTLFPKEYSEMCRSQCFDDSDLMTLMTRDALKYKIEDEPTHKKSMLVSLGKKIVNAPLSLGKAAAKVPIALGQAAVAAVSKQKEDEEGKAKLEAAKAGAKAEANAEPEADAKQKLKESAKEGEKVSKQKEKEKEPPKIDAPSPAKEPLKLSSLSPFSISPFGRRKSRDDTKNEEN